MLKFACFRVIPRKSIENARDEHADSKSKKSKSRKNNNPKLEINGNSLINRRQKKALQVNVDSCVPNSRHHLNSLVGGGIGGGDNVMGPPDSITPRRSFRLQNGIGSLSNLSSNMLAFMESPYTSTSLDKQMLFPDIFEYILKY